MAGRDSQDLKRKEEEKTKRLLEERNREKEEEKAARERIKQQIAMVSLSVCLLSVTTKLTYLKENDISTKSSLKSFSDHYLQPSVSCPTYEVDANVKEL